MEQRFAGTVAWIERASNEKRNAIRISEKLAAKLKTKRWIKFELKQVRQKRELIRRFDQACDSGTGAEVKVSFKVEFRNKKPVATRIKLIDKTVKSVKQDKVRPRKRKRRIEIIDLPASSKNSSSEEEAAKKQSGSQRSPELVKKDKSRGRKRKRRIETIDLTKNGGTIRNNEPDVIIIEDDPDVKIIEERVEIAGRPAKRRKTLEFRREDSSWLPSWPSMKFTARRFRPRVRRDKSASKQDPPVAPLDLKRPISKDPSNFSEELPSPDSVDLSSSAFPKSDADTEAKPREPQISSKCQHFPPPPLRTTIIDGSADNSTPDQPILDASRFLAAQEKSSPPPAAPKSSSTTGSGPAKKSKPHLSKPVVNQQLESRKSKSETLVDPREKQLKDLINVVGLNEEQARKVLNLPGLTYEGSVKEVQRQKEVASNATLPASSRNSSSEEETTSKQSGSQRSPQLKAKSVDAKSYPEAVVAEPSDVSDNATPSDPLSATTPESSLQSSIQKPLPMAEKASASVQEDAQTFFENMQGGDRFRFELITNGKPAEAIEGKYYVIEGNEVTMEVEKGGMANYPKYKLEQMTNLKKLGNGHDMELAEEDVATMEQKICETELSMQDSTSPLQVRANISLPEQPASSLEREKRAENKANTADKGKLLGSKKSEPAPSPKAKRSAEEKPLKAKKSARVRIPDAKPDEVLESTDKSVGFPSTLSAMDVDEPFHLVNSGTEGTDPFSVESPLSQEEGGFLELTLSSEEDSEKNEPESNAKTNATKPVIAFRVGQEVSCWYEAKEKFFPATIARIEPGGDYFVTWKDGDKADRGPHPESNIKLPSEVDNYPDVKCMICAGSDPKGFLLCEENCASDHGGHFRCFGLKSIPSGDWYCPKHATIHKQETEEQTCEEKIDEECQEGKQTVKSQYGGVYWESNSLKWRSRVYAHGTRHSGGSFESEIEAALAANNLCRMLSIPLKNPSLERKETQHKSSKHPGVIWDVESSRWRAWVQLGNQEVLVGFFTNEQEAAYARQVKENELRNKNASKEAANYEKRKGDGVRKKTVQKLAPPSLKSGVNQKSNADGVREKIVQQKLPPPRHVGIQLMNNSTRYQVIYSCNGKSRYVKGAGGTDYERALKLLIEDVQEQRRKGFKVSERAGKLRADVKQPRPVKGASPKKRTNRKPVLPKKSAPNWRIRQKLKPAKRPSLNLQRIFGHPPGFERRSSRIAGIPANPPPLSPIPLVSQPTSKPLSPPPRVPRRLRKEKSKASRSQYSGVYCNKLDGKWQGQIRIGRKSVSCGRYADETQAAHAVNMKCDEYGIPRKNPELGDPPPEFQLTAARPRSAAAADSLKVSDPAQAESDAKEDVILTSATVTIIDGFEFVSANEPNIHDENSDSKVKEARNDKINEKRNFRDPIAPKKKKKQDPIAPTKKKKQDPIASATKKKPKRKQSSKYVGVAWSKRSRKWRAIVCIGGKQHYAGYYKSETDAGCAVNTICQQHGLAFKNRSLGVLRALSKPSFSSEYTGVYWDSKRQNWRVGIKINKKHISGGSHKTEIAAARAVNLICRKHNIPLKNPAIASSKYVGVSWMTASRKWRAIVYVNGKLKHAGCYTSETDAGRAVNTMCQQHGLAFKNPSLGTLQVLSKPSFSSEYIGVSWKSQNQKWLAQIVISKANIYGGLYETEIAAARAVNALCRKHGIPLKNPSIEIQEDDSDSSVSVAGTSDEESESYSNSDEENDESDSEQSSTTQASKKKSKYKGVEWLAREGQYRVKKNINGKLISGGLFDTELEAAHAADDLFCKFRGGWLKGKIGMIGICLNFMESYENFINRGQPSIYSHIDGKVAIRVDEEI